MSAHIRRILATALLASACRAPDDALVHSCTTSVLSLFTECEATAKVLREPRIASIDSGTKNFKVRLSATLTVAKGRVAFAVPGCGENGRAEVSADRPASFECDAEINRSTSRFQVQAKPLGGDAEGFAAKLRFRPI